MAFWLFKSEPACFSFADLLAAPGRTTGWDGIRNFQARNYLRDSVAVGDGVLFYHSNSDPPSIAGVAEGGPRGPSRPVGVRPIGRTPRPEGVTRRIRPGFRSRSLPVRPIEPPIGLARLRTVAAAEGMELLRKGSRLSIQPVSRPSGTPSWSSPDPALPSDEPLPRRIADGPVRARRPLRGRHHRG